MAFARGKALAPAPSNDPHRDAYWVPPGYRGGRIPYRDGWDLDRAVERGFTSTPWVWRCVRVTAQNQAKLPMLVRDGHWHTGKPVELDSPVLDILNYHSSMYELALHFRLRLSEILLLNPMGAFVEVVRSRRGDVLALQILPPGRTYPIPDPRTFVAGYRVYWPGTGYVDVPAEDVVWIRDPHPVDPYKGITPLEAAGLSIEADYYARLYNRNFLLNDARPGGALVVKGDMDPQDQAELRDRFTGGGSGYSGAGRLTVLAAEGGVDYVDFATSPREMNYEKLRATTKEEILMAFGTPESVLGNASGRTFDNADAELEVWWRETEIPHLDLIGLPFSRLVDTNPKHFAHFDLTSVPVLQRDRRARRTEALGEVAAGVRTEDEYRQMTDDLKPVGLTTLYNRFTGQPAADTSKPFEPIAPPAGDGQQEDPSAMFDPAAFDAAEAAANAADPPAEDPAAPPAEVKRIVVRPVPRAPIGRPVTLAALPAAIERKHLVPARRAVPVPVTIDLGEPTPLWTTPDTPIG